MAKEDNMQIFMDKIRLAGSLIQKEFDMINHVNNLKRMVKNGYFDQNRKTEFAEWTWAWQNLSELYDFLKYQYMDLLEEKDQISKKRLEDIMNKYSEGKAQLEYSDLLFAFDGVLQVMALSKFHDVGRKGESGDFLAEED